MIRIVNEKCYPYESGESGVAPDCKVSAGSKFYCPSDNKVYTKQFLTASSAYPLKVESQVTSYNLKFAS